MPNSNPPLTTSPLSIREWYTSLPPSALTALTSITDQRFIGVFLRMASGMRKGEYFAAVGESNSNSNSNAQPDPDEGGESRRIGTMKLRNMYESQFVLVGSSGSPSTSSSLGPAGGGSGKATTRATTTDFGSSPSFEESLASATIAARAHKKKKVQAKQQQQQQQQQPPPLQKAQPSAFAFSASSAPAPLPPCDNTFRISSKPPLHSPQPSS
ncbi:hypothetical protein ScalyP_jg4061, partial [Parmales sp. scaly parma]